MCKLRWFWLAVIGVLATAITSEASVSISFTPSDYDNANPPTTGLFRDFLDQTFPAAPFGSKINQGLDLGGTGHTALNFTEGANNQGPAGYSAITLYDTTPGDATAGTQTLLTGSMTLSADVLFNVFNNAKSVGLVGLFNEGAGEKGLALMLRDAGNSDIEALITTSQTSTSLVSPLASAALNTIGENKWYRLVMDITIDGDNLSVTGEAFKHITETDPDSALVPTALATVNYSGLLSTLGLQATGQIGLVANYNQVTVNSSVTNFSAAGGGLGAAVVPEVTSIVVWSLFGCIGLTTLSLRRRKSA